MHVCDKGELGERSVCINTIYSTVVQVRIRLYLIRPALPCDYGHNMRNISKTSYLHTRTWLGSIVYGPHCLATVTAIDSDSTYDTAAMGRAARTRATMSPDVAGRGGEGHSM